MTETTPPPPAATPTPTTPPKPRKPSSVIIRPWPKVVFLYPTFILATIFLFVSFFSEKGSTEGIEALGNAYMLVFFVNLLVFAFDFSRIKSITLVVLIIAIVMAVMWADTKWPVVGKLSEWMHTVDIRMNTQFYGFMSAFLGFVMLIVLINTRFNYYEVNHREILHHHGYLGDVTRFPTQGLRLNKEIHDLMEYLLLHSGRLVFYPSTVREAIVIDNVIGVNAVEDRIKDLLSKVAVTTLDQESFS